MRAVINITFTPPLFDLDHIMMTIPADWRQSTINSLPLCILSFHLKGLGTETLLPWINEQENHKPPCIFSCEEKREKGQGWERERERVREREREKKNKNDRGWRQTLKVRKRERRGGGGGGEFGLNECKRAKMKCSSWLQKRQKTGLNIKEIIKCKDRQGVETCQLLLKCAFAIPNKPFIHCNAVKRAGVMECMLDEMWK